VPLKLRWKAPNNSRFSDEFEYSRSVILTEDATMAFGKRVDLQDGRLFFFDPRTLVPKKGVPPIGIQASDVSAGTFSWDAQKLLLIVQNRKRLNAYEVSSGRLLYSIPAPGKPRPLQLSPEFIFKAVTPLGPGEVAVQAGEDGNYGIYLIDEGSGKITREIGETVLFASPSVALFAVAESQKEPTKQLVVQIYGGHPFSLVRSLKIPDGDPEYWESSTLGWGPGFHPLITRDGRYLAILRTLRGAEKENGVIYESRPQVLIYDTQSGQRVGTYSAGCEIQDAALSPNGGSVALVGRCQWRGAPGPWISIPGHQPYRTYSVHDSGPGLEIYDWRNGFITGWLENPPNFNHIQMLPSGEILVEDVLPEGDTPLSGISCYSSQ
jgi:hypothetical protein